MFGSPQSIHKKWEVWQVEWPHEDGTSKKRTALLLSSDAHNATSDKLWFIKITSTFIRRAKFRIEVKKCDPRFKGSGLNKHCYIYPELAKILDKEDVYWYKGTIYYDDIRKEIWKTFVKVAGLPP